MTKKRSTKRALALSFISLLLCVSMFVGTTFAWFTDSVSSTNNIIKAGNLDVELEYYDAEAKEWKVVGEQTNVFEQGTLWEPGHTEVVYLKVSNLGTLALKYQLGVNVASEILGKTEDGKDIKLSDYLVFKAVDITEDKVGAFTRDTAKAEAGTEIGIKAYNSGEKKLEKQNDANYVALIVYMPETVGNEANYRGNDIPTINLGINLFATQVEFEEDSFDKYYDENAAVFTVDDANAQMAENLDVTLVNCNEPEGVLYVPADYTGTLTIVNSTVKSVQGAGDVNLVVLGNVVVNAKGTGATTLAATAFDGSAITANGKLSISGKGNLTAIAADEKGAFGIGGMNTTEVSIKDITIDYVSGSYAYGVGTDTKYYKDAPEGGAAIGSGYDGAAITLDNVTVTKAIGGSKAAGIGARYHVGVTVTIKDSDILYVEGGVSAAGIGGSRVSGDATENGTTINITNSTVTAKGGAYGAGIGSGYDTHCLSKQPLCTINITGSTIDATGGKYAAGVGTGYHNAALAGEIKNSTVVAKSGDKFYKAEYSTAMDIGFGVVDPAREGVQNGSIVYKGVTLTYKNAPTGVASTDALISAIQSGKTEILLAKGNYTMPSTSADITLIGTKEVNIELPFKSVSGNKNVITFDGVTIVGETNSSWYSDLFNGATKVVYKNCEIYNKLTTYCDSEFINCNFYNTFDNEYSVYCYSGSKITFDNCSFDSKCSKAIKVYDEGNGGRKVYINDCEFTTETANKKAAVEIDSTFSTYYIYFTGNNVIKGAYTKLWNSDPSEDKNIHVYINGDDVINTIKIGTLQELINFANDVNVNGNGYSGKTVVLTADIDLNNMEWTPIGQTGGNGVATYFCGTFDGKGYTISNLKITNNSYDEGKNYAAGFFGFVDAGDAHIRNLTIDGANVNGHHWTGVIAGYLTGSISNCSVKNATVTCTHANDDACGDKAGVIVGYINNGTVYDNTATKCTVAAGRDAGQIVGAAKTTQVYNNTINNVTVTAAGGCTGANVNNAVIGRVLG